jgi:ectoine hydroxylase-related dioxygenase (phytanoyl-CoA dioxygenase family)
MVTSKVPGKHADSFFVDADYSIDAFRELVGRTTTTDDVPYAASVQRNVPVYDGSGLAAINRDPDARRQLLGEWAWVLAHGPGVFAVNGALGPHHRLDEATEIFQAIIDEQHTEGKAIGDHFAKAGSNDRIWNSHEKLAVRSPEIFVAYYSADAIALGCEAWLGPHYQISAQVNRVNPGGEAQAPHRDYHVGFYDAVEMDRFPRHVHLMSQGLTLQAAVAHTDMPLESGPTMLLPYSQLCEAGFIASYRDDFREVFHEFMVQLPLRAGDMVFFNPALMHGAGANRVEGFQRIANLLQVSSAFGRTMETMTTDLTALAVYPFLAALDERARENVIAAACEGYAFPTNLDLDPPIGGLAPESQADMIRTAVGKGWSIGQVAEMLAERAVRRQGWPHTSMPQP